MRYGITALSGIAISLTFAHLASKELFGQYQLILSILSLFSIFSLPGLNMAALKAVSHDKPYAVIEAVRKSFLFSLGAIPFLLAYAAYLYIRNDESLAATLLLATILFPFFYAPNTWYTYYEGKSRFSQVAIRVIISTIAVTLAVMLGLVYKLSLIGITTLFLATSAILTSLFFWEVKRKVPRSSRPQLDVAYGQRVTWQKFAFTLTEALPPLAISFWAGHTALATFQMANIFLSGISGLIGALAAISLPQLFADKDHRHTSTFLQNLFIGVIASISYFVIVELFFLKMYGQTYHASYVIARLIACIPLLISLRMFLVNYFTARDKNELIVIIYIAANSIGLIVFASMVTHSISLEVAGATYLYILNALLLIPLIFRYFRS